MRKRPFNASCIPKHYRDCRESTARKPVRIL